MPKLNVTFAAYAALLAAIVVQSQNALANSCIELSNAKFTAKSADFTPFFEGPSPTMTRVIIGFRKRSDDHRIASIVRGRIIHRLDFINAIAAEVPNESIPEIASDPSVRVVEIDPPIGILPIAEEPSPTIPDQEQQTPVGIARTKAPAVWSTTKGKGSVVAIIDTGIEKTHPDLAGRVIGGRNFSSEDREAWNDGHGHGTHVSGTVAANDNAIGVVGMAPEASLLGIKVLNDYGSGSYSDVVAGVEYAIQAKAQVANMSLGGTSDVQSLHEAVKKAHQQGLIIAAAAGNSGEDYGNPLNYPGAYPEVVGIGAVDDNDLRAYFSSFNKFVALAAPGVKTLSTEKNGSYARHSGTSMATPHVAGGFALLRAMYPNESTVEMKRRLVCNADDQFPEGRDVWTGHGILNVRRALANAAPQGCVYLRGDATEPTLPTPRTGPDAPAGSSASYVQSTALSLVNDGTTKQLLVTVKIVDAARRPVARTSVAVEMMEYATGPLGIATGTTNAKGEAQFLLTGFTCGKFMASVKSSGSAGFSREYGQPEAVLDLGTGSEGL